MNIVIKNEGEFSNIIIYLYKENKKKTKIKVGTISQKELDIDINIYRYISFKSNKKKSPKIYLNEYCSCFVLKNIRDNLINVYIENNKIEKTGKVLKMNMKDIKNLSYRPGTTKRIFTFVPSSYDPNKKYALLVAFDGQNLFSQENTNKYTVKNDCFGSWQLDVSLSLICQDTIVVSIDNADKWRDFELLMNDDFGEHEEKIYKEFEKDTVPHIGRLDEIGRFIMTNVLPYCMKNYSIDESRIGIMGSSSGGIASFYLGMEYSNIFTHIFSFSPAINLFKKEAYSKYFASKHFSLNKRPLLYLYYGGKRQFLEKDLLPSYYFINDILHFYSHPNDLIINSYNKEGRHNEMFWRYECLNALKYFK